MSVERGNLTDFRGACVNLSKSKLFFWQDKGGKKKKTRKKDLTGGMRWCILNKPLRTEPAPDLENRTTLRSERTPGNTFENRYFQENWRFQDKEVSGFCLKGKL